MSDEITGYIAGKAVFDNIFNKMNNSKLKAEHELELRKLKRKADEPRRAAAKKTENQFTAMLRQKEIIAENALIEAEEAKELARSWQRTATEAMTARDAWRNILKSLFKEDKIKAEKSEINKIFNDTFDENIGANLKEMIRIR